MSEKRKGLYSRVQEGASSNPEDKKVFRHLVGDEARSKTRNTHRYKPHLRVTAEAVVVT